MHHRQLRITAHNLLGRNSHQFQAFQTFKKHIAAMVKMVKPDGMSLKKTVTTVK